MSRVVAVANQKGGVGKTTTAINLGAALAALDRKVLILDLDPQANATSGLGFSKREEATVYRGLSSGDLSSAVRETGFPNLSLAPSGRDLVGAEIELVDQNDREARLRFALGSVRQAFDPIFIDCPPSLGLLTVNALVAADEVLIPIQCEYYALEGLGQLIRNIELVQAHLNNSVQISTILLTMYDGRTRLADQVAQEVRGHFGNLVLESVVPRSVRVSEAPGYGQSVLTYDPGSRGAITYLDAAREIAERGVPRGGKRRQAQAEWKTEERA